MGEQVFGTFALGLDNTSWVIVVEIWLHTIFMSNNYSKSLLFELHCYDDKRTKNVVLD